MQVRGPGPDSSTFSFSSKFLAPYTAYWPNGLCAGSAIWLRACQAIFTGRSIEYSCAPVGGAQIFTRWGRGTTPTQTALRVNLGSPMPRQTAVDRENWAKRNSLRLVEVDSSAAKSPEAPSQLVLDEKALLRDAARRLLCRGQPRLTSCIGSLPDPTITSRIRGRDHWFAQF